MEDMKQFFDEKGPNTGSFCFLKYGPNPASLVYFRPFLNAMTNIV